jgi:uncharacterized SAM-binding protein YcdF (DUF218 family)
LALRLTALLVTAVVAYVGVTGLQVALAAGRDQRAAADVIVVLGAAQYDGRPSPVFRARLDHALTLYRQGVAPSIAVTGGQRPEDRVTEATAARNYLFDHGVPEEAILRVPEGSSTWESLSATALALRQRGLTDVVLVSDPPHALRTKLIGEGLGLSVQLSPTPTSPAGLETVLRQAARETAAVALGRLLGHRRLADLDRRLAAGRAQS